MGEDRIFNEDDIDLDEVKEITLGNFIANRPHTMWVTSKFTY